MLCKMKAKSLEIEAYKIAETTRKLGCKSSKTIYRLLNKIQALWRNISGMNIQMLSAEKELI